jgi:hypothetical protein
MKAKELTNEIVEQHGFKRVNNSTFRKNNEEGLKIFRVEFEGAYPVDNCLVLAAYNQQEAEEMAQKTIAHTSTMVVNEMTINEPQVIEYLSGVY